MEDGPKSTLWNLNPMIHGHGTEEGEESEIYLVEFELAYRPHIQVGKPESEIYLVEFEQSDYERVYGKISKVRNLPCGI